MPSPQQLVSSTGTDALTGDLEKIQAWFAKLDDEERELYQANPLLYRSRGVWSPASLEKRRWRAWKEQICPKLAHKCQCPFGQVMPCDVSLTNYATTAVGPCSRYADESSCSGGDMSLGDQGGRCRWGQFFNREAIEAKVRACGGDLNDADTRSKRDQLLSYGTCVNVNSPYVAIEPPSILLQGFCTVSAYVPILLVAVMFLKLLFRRGTSQLVNISFLGVLVFVNEIVIKKLMRQSRPAESCAGNFGMPSGHSTVSAGLFTLKILQLIYKTDLHMQLRKNAIRVWKGYHDEYEVVQNENEQNADNKINKNIVAQLELEGGKELDHVANTSSTTPATDKARAGTGGCAASGRRRAQMMPQAHQEAPEDEVQLDVAIVPASSDQSTTDENYDTSEEGRMQNRLSAIEEEIMDDEAERLLSFSSNFKGGAQAADAATIQEMAVGIYGPEDAAIARASVHYPRILENESENTGRREGLKLVGRNDRNKNNRSKSSGNTNNAKSNMIKVKMTKAEDDVVVGDEGAATENEDFCSVAPPPLNTGTRRSKRPASLSTTTKRAPQRSDDLYFLYSRLLRRPFSRLFGCCEAEKYDYNGNFCDAGEDEVVSHAEAALWAFVWVGLLGPVGPCRAVLRDHTPSQIMTGLISGFCVGALCFLATRALARRCSHHLGRHICCFLKHDFAVPFHQFRIQILEDTLPRLKVKISARSQTKQLQNPRHAAHQQDDDYTTTTSSSGASSARPSAQGQAMRTSSRVFQKITDQEEYETIRHFRSILLQVQWYYRQRKAALSRAEKEGLDQDISACTHKVSEVMELRRCVRQAMKECFFFSPAEDDLLKRNNNNRNPRYKVGENFAAPGDLIQLVGEQEYDDQITENNATTMLNNLEPQVPLLNGNGQHIIMPALEENVVDHDTTSRQEEEPCTSNAEAALTEPLLGSAK